MRQLFGTDGIRGVAGEYPLDSPTAFAVGVALARWIGEQRVRRAPPEGLGTVSDRTPFGARSSEARTGPTRPSEPSGTRDQPDESDSIVRANSTEAQVVAGEVVIGIDTRESGPWIAEHVAAGLQCEGVTARFAGLITTPGLAHAARIGPFAAGVMISASHNPYQDNGIKIIDHSGFKLPDEQEHAIEQHIFAFSGAGLRPAGSPVPQPLVDRPRPRPRVSGLPRRHPSGRPRRRPHRRGWRARFGVLSRPGVARAARRQGRSHLLLPRRTQHQSALRLAASGTPAREGARDRRGSGRGLRRRCRPRPVRLAFRQDRGWRRRAAAHRASAARPRQVDGSRGHGDVQPRAGARLEEPRHRPCAHRRRRQIRPRGNAAPRRAARRRAERPRYLSRLLHYRRRPADRLARARSHALHRPGPGPARPRR